MKKYDLAIFDLDGTILDTIADLSASLNAALTANGLPARTLEEALRFVGNGIRKLVERGVPAGTAPEVTDRVFAAFKAHYAEHSMDATRPYTGMEALLKKLRSQGMMTAVLSNKVDGAVKALCEHYYPGLFHLAAGEKPGVARKPAPDAVNWVLESLGVPRERAVYVGDSEVDVLTAQNAGMDSVIVTWGFREEAFLREQGARRLVHTMDELYAALTE